MTLATHAPRRATDATVSNRSPRGQRARRPLAAGPSNQFLQAKLRVGTASDPLEREADRVAEAVVSGAAAPSLSAAGAAVQRKCAECEAQEKTIRREVEKEEDDQTIQTKAEAGGSTSGGAVQAAAAVSSGGAPLSADARAYFEPRFGRDLSGVRVHTDATAADATRNINARAYTLGRDIAFASGEYAPATHEGRRLIAHELAHVGQQRDPAVIRRTIEVSSDDVSLDSYFSGERLTGVKRSGNAYTHAKGGEVASNQEVPTAMLSSPRAFAIAGEDTDTAEKNIKAHVTARRGIVSFAAQKKYTFASVTGFKMNPKFYDTDPSKASWSLKPGVDKQAAWDDLNVHPEEYAIGCKAARDLTQAGGSKGSAFVNVPSTDEGDWVPGDAGYVINTKHPADGGMGTLGENIIYTGDGKFWGHLPSDVMYRTLAEWKTEVESWNQGAKVDTERELPSRGLA